MTVKNDSLTRLIERTTEHADVVQPMVRPMFSHAAIRKGTFTHPADLPMVSETFAKPVLTPDSPTNGTSFPRVQQPDTPRIDSPPASPDADASPVLQEEADSGQEYMSNTPGHRVSSASLPLLPSAITERPSGHHMPSGPSGVSERDQSSIDVTGSREPVNIDLLFSEIGNNVSTEARPLLKSPLLSVEASECSSLLSGQAPGNQSVSIKEPLKSKRRFRTGIYEGKRAKAGDEPAASVVRVTIGRIDVRAVMHQPTVQAPTVVPEPVKPALSLNEYLRQRDGGKR